MPTNVNAYRVPIILFLFTASDLVRKRVTTPKVDLVIAQHYDKRVFFLYKVFQ